MSADQKIQVSSTWMFGSLSMESDESDQTAHPRCPHTKSLAIFVPQNEILRGSCSRENL